MEQDELIHTIFKKEIRASELFGDYMVSQFKTDSVSELENTINSYVILIPFAFYPFSIVKSKHYRSCNHLQANITVETVQDTIIISSWNYVFENQWKERKVLFC